MTQQNVSSKKVAGYLFVGGDANGRLTDEAAHVCSLVGIEPRELQMKTLEDFVATAKNEAEANREFKLFEKNRLAKIDVIARNLTQLRNTQSPGRKMAMTFTSLAMAPEERHLHSQGQRQRGSATKLDPRLWQQSPNSSQISKKADLSKLETQEKQRQKWLNVLQRKEQIFEQHTQTIAKRFEKRFDHERKTKKEMEELKEWREEEIKANAEKHAAHLTKKVKKDQDVLIAYRKENEKSLNRIKDHNMKRQERLEQTAKETALKSRQFWPESPEKQLDDAIKKQMNSSFGAGFDLKEKRGKMQSILEYQAAHDNLGEKVNHIDYARQKRKQNLDQGLKFIRSDFERVQELYDAKYAHAQDDYDNRFRTTTEKLADEAKRARRNANEAKEMIEFNIGEKATKKQEQVTRFEEAERKRLQKCKAITAKHNQKRDEKIQEMRQSEVEAMHEARLDHSIIQSMNMSRRKRMQSEYRQGLVEQMLDKKHRAMSLEKVRGDIIGAGAHKHRSTANHMYQVMEVGRQTMQPQTIEAYKKEYDVERKRKAKAKMGGPE